MNLQWNVETFILLGVAFLSTLLSLYIMKFNWRQYGLLYILTVIAGNSLCLLFVSLGYYSYPFNLFPKIISMPFSLLLTLFPCYVMFGVRYSPTSWKYKIPFYWVLVHIGMFFEVLAQRFTDLIIYERYWDSWDSYTWWWLFLLVFELIGGVIVSSENRKPILEDTLKYGRLGWYISHFILIITIFLAGFYAAKVL